MSAATTNSTQFRNYKKFDPENGEPKIMVDVTLATTEIDDVNDRVNLLAFPACFDVVGFDLLLNGDGDTHATPTLDGDLMIATGCTYASDSGTEATLYNAGTRWQAASTTRLWVDYATQTAASDVNGLAYLRWKVIAAAATAQAFQIKGVLYLKSR